MANKTIGLTMLKEIIRLKQKGYSNKKISRITGKSRPTIIKYVSNIEACMLDYSELLKLTGEELAVFLGLESEAAAVQHNKINIELSNFLDYAKNELDKTGVTRKLLWQEYIGKYSDGLKYSQFCYHLQNLLKKKEGYMPVDHKMGDKLYVDFTGKKFHIVDPDTGELYAKECFVAILGASQYTYAEACESQKVKDFLQALENAFHYFGGVPACVVVDNLKSGVTKPSKYEAEINENLARLAAHYDTVIMPARPYKAKDKSLAEGAVNLVYQRIFAPLRNEIFSSTHLLNQGIKPYLQSHNRMPFQGENHSREYLFLEFEKQSLKLLPATRFEIKEHRKLKIQPNCHVHLRKEKQYYSAPYQYIGKYVKVLISHRDVEIYYKYKRIAFHQRPSVYRKYITIKEHMPSTHRHVHDMQPEKLLERANKIGPFTKEYLQHVMANNSYPEQGYKSCQGILAQVSKVGADRLEKACERALEYQVYNYGIILNILEKGLDKLEENETEMLRIPFHENIRGKKYYK